MPACRWYGVDCTDCDDQSSTCPRFEPEAVACPRCGTTNSYWGDCVCDGYDEAEMEAYWEEYMAEQETENANS